MKFWIGTATWEMSVMWNSWISKIWIWKLWRFQPISQKFQIISEFWDRLHEKKKNFSKFSSKFIKKKFSLWIFKRIVHKLCHTGVDNRRAQAPSNFSWFTWKGVNFKGASNFLYFKKIYSKFPSTTSTFSLIYIKYKILK